VGAPIDVLTLRGAGPIDVMALRGAGPIDAMVLSTQGVRGPPGNQFVTYEDFHVDLTGATPADAQVKACHDWANANNVSVMQSFGRVLLRGVPNLLDGSADVANQINVRTDCDLTGLTVVTDALSGSVTQTFNSPALYNIMSDDSGLINVSAEDIADLLANHAGQLVKGSKYIDHPIFTDHPFAMIFIFSTEVEMKRNGTVLINKRDFVETSKLGNLAVGLERDFTTISGITIRPREKQRLTFHSPHFEANGTISFRALYISRSQTDLFGMTFKEIGGDPVTREVAPANSRRVLVDWQSCFDVTADGLTLVGQDNGEADGDTATASYGIRARTVIGLHIRNARGYGGWGLLGNDWLKDFTIEHSTINRVDVHWFSYNCVVYRCRLVNVGIRATGGGWTIDTCTWVITATTNQSGDVTDAGDVVNTTFFAPRKDYGSDFEGEITVRNLTIEIGSGFLPGGTLVLCRLDVMTASGAPYDPGRDTTLPQIITFDGVRIKAPSPIGIGAEFTVIGLYMQTVGYKDVGAGIARKVYYPTKAIFNDVEWVNPDANQRLTFTAATSFFFADASVYVKGRQSDTTNRFGTNCEIVARNCKSVNNTKLALSSEGMLINFNQDINARAARYTDPDAWHPHVMIDGCDPCLITDMADGKISVMRSTVMRLRTASNGTPVQLIRFGMCDIKPIDSNATSGAAAYFWTSHANVQYSMSAFYIPLDNNGTFGGAISLSGSKGGLNTLQDGAVSGTHYTNVPAGFFM
jgi:hypothetical protein